MSSSADFTIGAEHRQHYNLTFAVLVLAGCTFALLQSLVAPALPELAGASRARLVAALDPVVDALA